MGVKRMLVLLGLLIVPGLEGKPSAPKINLMNFCNEQNQPIFIFQHLWTDSPQVAKRKHEFWVDRDKDLIRAFWWSKGAKPIFLIGSEISETDFFLCAYRLGQNKPFGAYAGQIHSQGIRLKPVDNETLFNFSYPPALAEARSYSLRYDSRSVKHQMIGRIPKDHPFTCDTTVSSFQLVASPSSKGIEHANRRLAELVQNINWDKETEDCQNPKTPSFVKALGVNLMFGSDRFLSAKMDFSQANESGGDLQGKSLNLDLVQLKDLDWNGILTPGDQKILLKEINRRIRLAYGDGAKVAELTDCSFSFTGQTLVVSASPQGVFEDRVDIPIPLDHMFGILKIKPYGPFASQ